MGKQKPTRTHTVEELILLLNVMPPGLPATTSDGLMITGVIHDEEEDRVILTTDVDLTSM